MTLISTPDCSICMATEWRTTCGEIRRRASSGNCRDAPSTASFSRSENPTRVSGLPDRPGKSGSCEARGYCFNHRFSSLAVSGHSGTERSLRPLPWMRIHAVEPNTRSDTRISRSSETRAPVLYKVASMTWSRCPVHVSASGTARIASICSRDRDPTRGCSKRSLELTIQTEQSPAQRALRTKRIP